MARGRFNDGKLYFGLTYKTQETSAFFSCLNHDKVASLGKEGVEYPNLGDMMIGFATGVTGSYENNNAACAE